MIETFKLITSVEFIEKWQTLIGSALGPFLAIILSVFGYYLKGKFQKISERKEAIRRAEISFAITLNQIYTTVGHINDFISRIKNIIDEVEKITDPGRYSLHGTNFPPIIDIYFDKELLKMRFKSYYIHNKILIINNGIRWTNSILREIKYDFEKLLELNKIMTEKENPAAQRETYVQNLREYVKMVQTVLNSLKTDNVKTIVQAKIYNLKLMKKYFWTIWKYEGASLKYFKNRKEKEEYNGSLLAVDRIDALLEKDTNELIQKTQKRATELGYEEF